ncbi:DUF6855 family protein [Octadecabacter sp. R77987]|uniref:DUF6855 family protein n=1 Tax=Octadecabacter sp. R77987 TaxID=3093874 RepID=UPI00366EBFAD
MTDVSYGSGTPDDPWVLKTPPLTSDFHVWKDEGKDPPALVVQVGKTQLSYQLRCLEDAHEMLKLHGDWMPLGNADEGKPVKEGTLEHWARSQDNPVRGYYGLRKGYRGRFANYVAPTLELLGFAELEHNARNNRIRAII